VAAFGREGDELVFFELNPNVTDIARKSFSFLEDSRAHTSVVPGDARLSLERELAHEPRPRALRSDRDRRLRRRFRPCAFADARMLRTVRAGARAWWRVVVHVSNRHIDLSAPVHGLATWAGLSAVELFFDGRSALLGGTQ
jgi:hypothetical protein